MISYCIVLMIMIYFADVATRRGAFVLKVSMASVADEYIHQGTNTTGIMFSLMMLMMMITTLMNIMVIQIVIINQDTNSKVQAMMMTLLYLGGEQNKAQKNGKNLWLHTWK